MNKGGTLSAIAVLCAVGLMPPLRAETLVNIASTETGETLYVDRDSLSNDRPIETRRFPAVRIWAVNQVPAGRRTSPRTERFQFSFNCTQRTSHILVYRNNRAGTRLQDWRAADLDYKYDYPKPGSLAEVALSFACSGGKMPVAPPKSAETEADVEDGE
jgi:hypothetical protein